MSKFHLILPLVAAAGLCACNDVDEQERFIEMPAVMSDRAVVLEDFTGQFCSHCPDAHEVMRQLSAQYGDKFIPVSIHTGNFAIKEGSNPKLVGLANDDSQAWAKNYPLSTYPAGSIDGGNLLNFPDWADAVRTAMAVPVTVNIELTAALADGQISGNVTLSTTEAVSDGLLQVWILENDIVAMQQNGRVVVPDYVHNDVMRASAPVDPSTLNFSHGTKPQCTYSVALKDIWDPENIDVVAIVRDATGRVLQAAKQKLLPQVEENAPTE